jgi:lysyl-tRNA synthetase class 2
LELWRANNLKPRKLPYRIDIESTELMRNISSLTETIGASEWWRPHVHADRRPFLLARNRVQAALRAFFSADDFIEVDTPALQVSPGNETHLHAFATEMIGSDGLAETIYLHTSPEFACKKLLAAGERRIFTFAHVYRNREGSPTHQPEFTMLEWYRAGEAYDALMRDCREILAIAAEAGRVSKFTHRGLECDPFAEPERVTVAEAFSRFAGMDLLTTINRKGETDRQKLAAQAVKAGIRIAGDDGWSDIFSRVLVEKVEPRLGIGRATILHEYPIAEAALARRSSKSAKVAERFELYACGVELANAFGELTDPTEQRRRFEMEMAEKLRIYGESYPLDEDFLTALSLMPQASGAALGFDRLVMLASGATRIEQVMWAPVKWNGR